MKMKRLFILIFILPIVGSTYGQDEPSITFNTTLEVGANITMSFNADAVDRPDIWIDWNLNGTRDAGEDVNPKVWGGWTQRQTYTLKNQTVNIYGKVKQFGAGEDRITSIDVTNNTDMTFLWLQSNQIEELDLTGQTEIYHLQVNDNQISGILDVSNLSKLQQLNVDRNNLTGLILGNNYPDLFQINFSRNFLSSENIDQIIASLPSQPGLNKSQGNFYCIDTRTSWSQFPEGTQLHQHHLDNAIFDGKWASLDVRTGGTEFRTISNVTNFYKISFSTTRSAGAQIILNIDADELDRADIWIDLNGNGIKEAGEEVTTFGSDASYTLGSQNFSIFGRVKGIKSSGNDLTTFDYLQNPFFNYSTSIDLSNNKLTELNLTANYLEMIEDLNIAENNLPLSEITNIIDKLADRNSTTPGTITLLDLTGKDGNEAINEHIAMANAKNYDVKDAAGNNLSPGDIQLKEQTMSEFGDIETYQANEVELPKTTDQGLEVSYVIEDGKESIATVEANKVTTIRYGEVKVTVTQSGNGDYNKFTKTITITILPVGDVFTWLEAPAISVIGNMVTLVGPEETLAHFTHLYINDEEVEMDEQTYDLTEHFGVLELKATSDDGTYMMRVTIER